MSDDDVERRAVSVYRLLGAPCVFCGYNGPGYWQSGTHDWRCPWYWRVGFEERQRVLSAFLRLLYLVWVDTWADDEGEDEGEDDG